MSLIFSCVIANVADYLDRNRPRRFGVFYFGRLLARRWRVRRLVCLCTAEPDVMDRRVPHAPFTQKLGVLERLLTHPEKLFSVFLGGGRRRFKLFKVKEAEPLSLSMALERSGTTAYKSLTSKEKYRIHNVSIMENAPTIVDNKCF